MAIPYKNKQFDASYKTYTTRLPDITTRYYYSEYVQYETIITNQGSLNHHEITMIRCARYDNDGAFVPSQVIEFHSRYKGLVKQLIAEGMSLDDIMGYINL